MSFDSLEQSEQDSQPVELFTFTRGASSWYYTDYPITITKFGITWLARAIVRSNVTMTNTVPKDTLDIKLPFDDSLVVPLAAGSAGDVTTVTVIRGHVDAEYWRLLWLGRIVKVSRSQAVATLTCEPVFNSLQRDGITQPYSRTCRHVFGGAGCFVDLASYTTHAPVASVTGAQLQLTLLTPPNFVGGTVVAADGSSRMVIYQVGSTVTLMRPIASIEPGDYVDVYVGCDRTLGTCNTVFGNAGNFGGQVGIPRINPFTVIRTVF